MQEGSYSLCSIFILAPVGDPWISGGWKPSSRKYGNTNLWGVVLLGKARSSSSYDQIQVTIVVRPLLYLMLDAVAVIGHDHHLRCLPPIAFKSEHFGQCIASFVRGRITSGRIGHDQDSRLQLIGGHFRRAEYEAALFG